MGTMVKISVSEEDMRPYVNAKLSLSDTTLETRKLVRDSFKYGMDTSKIMKMSMTDVDLVMGGWKLQTVMYHLMHRIIGMTYSASTTSTNTSSTTSTKTGSVRKGVTIWTHAYMIGFRPDWLIVNDNVWRSNCHIVSEDVDSRLRAAAKEFISMFESCCKMINASPMEANLDFGSPLFKPFEGLSKLLDTFYNEYSRYFKTYRDTAWTLLMTDLQDSWMQQYYLDGDDVTDTGKKYAALTFNATSRLRSNCQYRENIVRTKLMSMFSKSIGDIPLQNIVRKYKRAIISTMDQYPVHDAMYTQAAAILRSIIERDKELSDTQDHGHVINVPHQQASMSRESMTLHSTIARDIVDKIHFMSS
jgi:hypothetical protein